jgi:hypothetical protein
MTRCGVAANRDASIGRDRRSTEWQRQDVAAPGGARLGDNSDSGRWETADTGMSGMVLFI